MQILSRISFHFLHLPFKLTELQTPLTWYLCWCWQTHLRWNQIKPEVFYIDQNSHCRSPNSPLHKHFAPHHTNTSKEANLRGNFFQFCGNASCILFTDWHRTTTYCQKENLTAILQRISNSNCCDVISHLLPSTTPNSCYPMFWKLATFCYARQLV